MNNDAKLSEIEKQLAYVKDRLVHWTHYDDKMQEGIQASQLEYYLGRLAVIKTNIASAFMLAPEHEEEKYKSILRKCVMIEVHAAFQLDLINGGEDELRSIH